jgi:hypothetical protein
MNDQTKTIFVLTGFNRQSNIEYYTLYSTKEKAEAAKEKEILAYTGEDNQYECPFHYEITEKRIF